MTPTDHKHLCFLSHLEFRIWVIIDSHCMNKESCWPKTETIATYANCTVRSVRRILSRLERIGFISRDVEHGRSRRNTYYRHKPWENRTSPSSFPTANRTGGSSFLPEKGTTPAAKHDTQVIPFCESSSKLKREKLFELFWEFYPHKSAKARALKIWLQIAADGTSLDLIVARAKVFAAKAREEATEMKYIPFPANWLDERRWEDDDLRERGAERSARKLRRLEWEKQRAAMEASKYEEVKKATAAGELSPGIRDARSAKEFVNKRFFRAGVPNRMKKTYRAFARTKEA